MDSCDGSNRFGAFEREKVRMVNLKGKTIREKVEIIGDLIKEYARHKFVHGLLEQIQPKGWEDVFWFVRNTLKYKKEPRGKDVLYEPQESLGIITVDCEDYTVLLGSLLMASGYPVRVKVVSNGTYHVFPEIGLPPQNPKKWIGLDATTGWVGERPYPPNYRPYVVMGLGRLGDMGSIKLMWREISLDEPLKPGDRLRFYYKAKWFIPDFIEKKAYELLMKVTHPDFSVVSVDKKDDMIVVEVVVRGEKEKELGALITAAVIATALAVGLIASYFTLVKVEKVIEVGKFPISVAALALLLFGLAALKKGR